MTETIRPEGEGWSHLDNPEETPALTTIEQAIPAERWRRWEAPALIEDSDTDVFVEEDGSMTRAVDITWSKNVLEKIRAGYQCLKCAEPQQTPFPETCGFCGYEIRKLQADDYEREFRGEKWVGPTESTEEALARLEEESARRTHRPGSSISPGGVVIPAGVDAA